MCITVTTGPMHNCHRCQSRWAVQASSSEEEEASESHGGVPGWWGLPVEAGSTGGSQGQPQPRASGKSVAKRQVRVQAGKSIHRSGSGSVRVTRVRHSLLVNRQVHGDEIKLGHQLAEMETGVLQYHWG